MWQLVAAVIAVIASGVAAQAERLETLVRVSGASPFAQCTLDRVAEQPGQNYLHSEVEPQIAVNPRNPNNVVALYQQDRWSNGGSRGLVASVSFDGGKTWEQVVVPGLSLCSGGRYQRATDPWLSFSRTGQLHLISLSLDIGRDGTPVGARNALLVSRSSDGGLSWTDPIPIVSETAGALHDKESITADPTDPTGALVYAAWDRYQRDGSKALFARSTDGGGSWEPARILYDPGPLGFTVGHQIVVLPDGVLLNAFTEHVPATGGSAREVFLAVLRSTDKGASWSPVTRALQLHPAAVREPDYGQEQVRTAEDLVDVAVDPRSGRVYAVWQDGGPHWTPSFPFTGQSHIVFAQSSDGGSHWSPPVRVDRAAPVSFALNLQAFTPSVAAAADGTIGVTYYDFRRNDQRPGARTDYWIVECLPARPGTCAHADNWDEELRLTRGAFDLRAAPVDRGYFLGDYEGLDADVLDFLALFAATDGSDPASIFFRRLSP